MAQSAICPRLDDPKMSLRSTLYTTQLLFFVLGHAPMPVELQKRYSNPVRMCLQSLPPLVFLFLFYLSGLQCFAYTYMFDFSHSWTDVVVGMFHSTWGIALIVISIISPYTNGRKFMKIHELLIEMENKFKQRLNVIFNAKAFISKYTKQGIWIISIGFLCSIPKIINLKNVDRIEVEIIFFYIRYTKYIVVLHALQYVDLLALFTVCLKKFDLLHNVSQFDFASAQHKYLCNNLRNVKAMHFDLYTAMRAVNDIFGWTLVVLIVHTLLDFSYMIFFVFYSLQDGRYTVSFSMYSNILY